MMTLQISISKSQDQLKIFLLIFCLLDLMTTLHTYLLFIYLKCAYLFVILSFSHSYRIDHHFNY